jgi:hypothetical protein
MTKDLAKKFLSEVRIGNSIYLFADGKFFGRGDWKDEFYIGVVSELTERLVTLSTTPNTNHYHGYNPFSNREQKRAETTIPLEYITDYQILDLKKA